MAALKRQLHTPAPAPRVDPAPERPRWAVQEGAVGPNPALQAQLDRLAIFAAETQASDVVRYSPRVRLAILTVGGAAPWLCIWLAVRAMTGLG